MTVQEALELLTFKVPELINIILKAMKKAIDKQVPKKPDIIGDGYDDNGNLIYDTWICPCCETQYELDYDDYKFCPECGQAIDRSEINNE